METGYTPSLCVRSLTVSNHVCSYSVQKMTDEGRITKSAHPGAFVPWTFRRFASKVLVQLVSPQMTSFLATVSLSKSAMEFCPLSSPLSPCKDVGNPVQSIVS